MDWNCPALMDRFLTLPEFEVTTLKWVHWRSNERLFGPLGYVSPNEY
jgi:hypothetical protein